ncbi:hypothetical protein OH492_19920 [Vibrio chagasii]|nr:hypothetical protein [Vibrio chagasii]
MRHILVFGSRLSRLDGIVCGRPARYAVYQLCRSGLNWLLDWFAALAAFCFKMDWYFHCYGGVGFKAVETKNRDQARNLIPALY